MPTGSLPPAYGLPKAKAALVGQARGVCGEALRGVWVVGADRTEPLHVRSDVGAEPVGLDAEEAANWFVDVGSAGGTGRDECRYAVCGFDAFEQFRTVLEGVTRIGVLVAVDRDEHVYDFPDLADRLHAVADRYGVGPLHPRDTRS